MTTTNEAVMTQVRSRDGTEIAYWTSGDGPPLVVVHGTPADHTRFGPLLPYLQPYVTVHAMDRRGVGASGDGPDYHVAREYEDVAAVVDAIAAGTGASVDVYGHSMGGFVAWGAAMLTSSIGKLVLYEGWPPTNPQTFAYPHGFGERLDALLAAGERDALLETYFRELLGMSDDEVSVFRAQPSWPARVAAAHTIARSDRAFFETPFNPRDASRITVPTLLLTGGESPESFRGDIEAVAAALPDARIALLDGQQHVGDVLAPQVFAERILAFLAEPG